MSVSELSEKYFMKIEREIDINAPVETSYAAMIEQISDGFIRPQGEPMPLKLEAWPGGRWFRDLGNNTGHLWGHVQVIKPPTLLELVGPMFMSNAVASHVQYRIAAQAGGSRVAVVHTVIGEMDPEHRKGVAMGWDFILDRIKHRATR